MDEVFVLMEEETLPEDVALRQQLLERRKNVRADRSSERALKSILVDLGRIHLANKDKNKVEAAIAEMERDALRQVITEQSLCSLVSVLCPESNTLYPAEYMEGLEVGLVTLRKAYNARILYFRGLQELSDSVMEVQWEGALADAIRDTDFEVQDHQRQADAKRRRQLYLDTLQDDHTTNQMTEGSPNTTSQACTTDACIDDRVCVICQCEFTRGTWVTTPFRKIIDSSIRFHHLLCPRLLRGEHFFIPVIDSG